MSEAAISCIRSAIGRAERSRSQAQDDLKVAETDAQRCRDEISLHDRNIEELSASLALLNGDIGGSNG